MRDIITIAKKELKALFSNRTMLAQMLLLPFGMIFGFMMMSSMMGNTAMLEEGEKLQGSYYVNAPEYFVTPFKDLGLESAKSDEIDAIKSEIENGDSNVLIVFPDNFELSNDVNALCDIEVWYNSSEMDSAFAQSLVIGVLDSVRPVNFTININDPESYDLGEEVDIMQEMLVLSFPIYAIMAIFMTTQAIAAESIVGEKERGFMNLLLITPVKRTNIAFGKLLSIFGVNVIGGISSMLGMLASVFATSNILKVGEMTYGLLDYAMLFAAAISCSFAMTSVVMFISAQSKTVKQAQSTSTFVMLALMLMGILSQTEAGMDIVKSIGEPNSIIPLWSGIYSLQNILNGSVEVNAILLTTGINVLFAIVVAVCAARLFEDEKIMQG
jgi:ABC-type Na+ efflux pump permease subunit